MDNGKENFNHFEHLFHDVIKYPKWMPVSIIHHLKPYRDPAFSSQLDGVDLEIIQKYFTDERLKKYWKKLSKFEYFDIFSDEPVGLSINYLMTPLFAYRNTLYDINKAKTQGEIKKEIEQIAKKLQSVIKPIRKNNFDIYIPYIYKQNSDGDLDSTDLMLMLEGETSRSTFAELEKNNGNTLTKLLELYIAAIGKITDEYEPMSVKINAEEATSTLFVKRLQRAFSRSYKSRFDTYTTTLTNIFFDKQFDKENIKRKAKSIFNHTNNKKYYGDAQLHGITQEIIDKYFTQYVTAFEENRVCNYESQHEVQRWAEEKMGIISNNKKEE